MFLFLLSYKSSRVNLLRFGLPKLGTILIAFSKMCFEMKRTIKRKTGVDCAKKGAQVREARYRTLSPRHR